MGWVGLGWVGCLFAWLVPPELRTNPEDQPPKQFMSLLKTGSAPDFLFVNSASTSLRKGYLAVCPDFFALKGRYTLCAPSFGMNYCCAAEFLLKFFTGYMDRPWVQQCGVLFVGLLGLFLQETPNWWFRLFGDFKPWFVWVNGKPSFLLLLFWGGLSVP